MLDLILTIAFFALIFGSFGYLVYRYSNNVSKNKDPKISVKKDPDKFGCH